MVYILWLLLGALCWKPILATVMVIYHAIRKETYDSAEYWGSLKDWFKSLIGLVKP